MLWSLVLALCLLSGHHTLADSTYDHHQLPTSVRPEKYRLEIITHLNDENGFKFKGDVQIVLNVNEDTNNITLHSQNLTIDQSKIEVKNLENENETTGQCVKSVDVNKKHDYYIMNLCRPLLKGGKYMLSMPFEGELNKNLFGYYRSSYVDKESKETRWMSITQFEPTAARLAFPCFDEPDMKAKFLIVLGHDKKFTAISNMPVKSSKDMEGKNGWVWDEFEESVPMSTYLVAYSVNDFSYDEVMLQLKNNVRFRTWARKDAMSQVEYAGQVGPKVLAYYEDQFDVKFPLPKIDQIAVPDFSAGAMENWGLVTYRETALLYAKNVSSASAKHRVASVISHELAHQWFGNLVTMKWWTDLWLNEGFATYVASLGVEYLHPEWDSYTEESVDNTLDIFKVDALKTSHPISVQIGHASQISQIFDSISYNKGSCVIRMMHLFLGDETFRRGVTAYLKKYAYKNAEQDNLWSSLTEVAHNLKTISGNYNIKEIMDSWTLQTGYPVITVDRDYDAKSASIKQTRYLLDTKAAREDNRNCWWIPLSYTTQKELNFNETQPREWLECTAEKTPQVGKIENIASADEWIIFNIQLGGLYKVKYDQKNWNMLIDQLMSKEFAQIHPMNRAQLIDDALDLAWTGDQDYDTAMRLIDYLMHEKEYIPWKAALDNLSAVNRLLRMTPQYQFFKKYMQKILTPIYETLGGINNTDLSTERLNAVKHKVLIAAWACRFEVRDCVPRSQEYLKEWQSVEKPDETNPIPNNMRSVVYCTAVRHGSESEWQFLWERYRNSNVASERQTILSALGCSREIWMLQRYLDWAFDEKSEIRKQDSFVVFGAIARGDVGFHLARDYFLDNIEKIYKYYDPETTRLSRLITPIANQMNTEQEYKLLKSFIEKNKQLFEKASEGVKRALETIEINAQWKVKNYLSLSRKLQDNL